MRRVLVICLILLLPLNMFALAMAASAMQPADAPQHAVSLEHLTTPHGAVAFADAYLPDLADCQSACDIDPDEPPAGADVHDSVNEEVGLRLAALADGVVTPTAPPRFSHSFGPLLKPPRAL